MATVISVDIKQAFHCLPAIRATRKSYQHFTATTLFLRSSRLLRLSLRSLLPHPHQPGLTPRLSQPPIRPFLSLRHLISADLRHRLLSP